MIGTVRKWIRVGNYGFIVGDDDKDYFTHLKYMVDESYTPSEGDVVQFKSATSNRGLYGYDVKLHEEPKEE